MIAARTRTVVAGAAAVLALAGCGASKVPAPPASVASTPAAVASSVPAVASTPSVPASVSVSPPAPASASASAPGSASPSPTASSSGVGSSPAAPSPRSTCTDLTIRVLIGSGTAGREFAALQFVNDGTASCDLYGYPTVTLELKGKTIGSVSKPGSTATSHRRLAPGDVAESDLSDYTDCQAPLSDTVTVIAPGSTVTSSRPGQLRACTLRLGALGPAE